MASGWMQIRGTRRRRAMDRGFALSDHADWDGLQAAIRATGAQQVWVTHGYTSVMVRSLAEQGLNARAIPTRFEGEIDESAEAAIDGAAEEPIAPLDEGWNKE
jgi:putative mRNA 3-end processing factor